LSVDGVISRYPASTFTFKSETPCIDNSSSIVLVAEHLPAMTDVDKKAARMANTGIRFFTLSFSGTVYSD
jgi:hypothetical protein